MLEEGARRQLDDVIEEMRWVDVGFLDEKMVIFFSEEVEDAGRGCFGGKWGDGKGRWRGLWESCNEGSERQEKMKMCRLRRRRRTIALARGLLECANV